VRLRRRRLVARACPATGWLTTAAAVNRGGDGRESCPICNAPIHCQNVTARDVRVPVHPFAPTTGDAVAP
jgi:hypothetical protein